MIDFSWRERVAALAVLATVGLAPAPAQAEQPSAPSLTYHRPIETQRRDDGTLARGLHSETLTSNWSGYAIAQYQTGQYYTWVQATWVVPAVTFGRTMFSFFAREEYSATWVEIGGFCLNTQCTSVDNSLIQLGIEENVSSSGATSYSAWYEMLPQAEVPITGFKVNPGNQITASLQCVSACSAGVTQSWLLSMTNNTTGQTWSQNFTYSSSLASADWIEEAPSSFGGTLPLADYSRISPFVPIVGANSAWNSLTLSANGIQMSDAYGQTSSPSSTDANGFAICWGYSSQPSCTAP